MQNSNTEITKEVIRYSEIIARMIQNGNSVEIHPSKDGIKVMEVRKKVVK